VTAIWRPGANSGQPVSTLSCRSRFSEPARRPSFTSTGFASMKQPFATWKTRPIADSHTRMTPSASLRSPTNPRVTAQERRPPTQIAGCAFQTVDLVSRKLRQLVNKDSRRAGTRRHAVRVQGSSGQDIHLVDVQVRVRIRRARACARSAGAHGLGQGLQFPTLWGHAGQRALGSRPADFGLQGLADRNRVD
jgi:hypothetical protein